MQRVPAADIVPAHGDGYDRDAEKKYPLLIVHDGVKWIEKGLLANTLDNLIGTSVAPVVVAFLDTIDDWWLEAGGSETRPFVDMLADELVPALEGKYRLQTSPHGRAVLGAQVGSGSEIATALPATEGSQESNSSRLETSGRRTTSASTGPFVPGLQARIIPSSVRTRGVSRSMCV